ncbi:MAG: hypothetical protein KKA07_04110 [Bacteroidetes bacterium]|nr:hypothetical protein [Bacteroidota bacterium]MBU1718236.1 hypothetical protein [Bacteroidota bacterium]
MNKPHWYIPVLLIAAGAGFAIICILLLVNPRNRRLVHYKIKTGAFILTWTAVTSCATTPVRTCYAPQRSPEAVEFSKIHFDNYNLVLEFPTRNFLSGQIMPRNAKEFSFDMINTKDSVVVQGPVHALDGTFDEAIEAFEIKFNKPIAPGDYFIRFYTCKQEEKDKANHFFSQYKVMIKNQEE